MPSTTPTAASAAAANGAAASGHAAAGIAPAAPMPAQARSARCPAREVSAAAPGRSHETAASAASASGTSTQLKYGIATTFAIGEISEISPKYVAAIGTSPKLIVSCSAASASAARRHLASTLVGPSGTSRRDASASSNATAPNDSQNDADSTANGS